MENTIAFCNISYEGNPKRAVELYVGDHFILHNPLFGDGKQPFINYFEKIADEYPNKSLEFVRELYPKTISWLYIRIKNGQTMRNILPWIYSDLMKTERLLSTGMQCNKFLKAQQTPIRCIDLYQKQSIIKC